MFDDARPQYSVSDLVGAAEVHGHSVTRRLVADWVTLGLIDRGTDRGRGQARGKDYRWSENQRKLFLTLLDKHGTVRRPTLLNIPVSLWLIWGDKYVPLRQARRALASWAGANESVGAQRSRIAARQVVSELDHPSATRAARKRLRELVEKAAFGTPIDSDVLIEAAHAVYDPHGRRPDPTPTTMTPETYVNVLEARLAAVSALAKDRTGDEPIPDQAFLSARQMYLTTGPTARGAVPLNQFEQQPAPQLIGWQETINSACIHLLTVLGFALREPQALPIERHPSGPSTRPEVGKRAGAEPL